MSGSRLRIEYLPLTALQPYERNARTHSADQVAQIAASIEAFGWSNPILTDDAGLIIAGHGRLAAATELGIAEVPVIRLEGLTVEQKRALALADNKLPLNAGWDETLLAAELQGLGDLQGLVGFSADELLRLLGGNQGLTDPDEAPPLPAEPVTRPGDLWLLGPHRLLCGDATNRNDVDQLMGGERASLFATDPPYLVDYTGNDRPNNSGKDWSQLYQEIPAQEALPFFRSAFSVAATVIAPNAAWYVWHAHKRVSTIEQIWTELDVLNHMQIVWVKPTALHTHTFYPWQHEPCLMGWRRGHKPRHDGNNSHDVTSVWFVDWEGKSRIIGNDHPTQKPVGLFTRPMQKHTIASEICYEPFSGSGSQLIAGEQLNRRVYGMEISPAFCDVAVARWENFTGRKADRRCANADAA